MRTKFQPSPDTRAAIRRFDVTAERFFGAIRGKPAADRVMYAGSELGDFGLVWLLVATARGFTSERRAREAVRLFVTLGVESILVNQVIKGMFRRRRPAYEGIRPHRLRRPMTSSFPSGHASSSACAVVLLADQDRLWPAYLAIGAIVATSRIHVRIHHASDVAAGIPIGLAIGLAARKWWPVDEPYQGESTNPLRRWFPA